MNKIKSGRYIVKKLDEGCITLSLIENDINEIKLKIREFYDFFIEDYHDDLERRNEGSEFRVLKHGGINPRKAIEIIRY
jgi:hypothetical protein